jgi:hypothetical protein
MNSIDHSSHLSFESISDDFTEDEAKALIEQVSEGCLQCIWELESHDVPCKFLVKVAHRAGLRNESSCPSDDDLILFSTLSLEGIRLVEVAAHVASCPRCGFVLFSEGGVAEKALEFLQKDADRAMAKAVANLKKLREKHDQFLNILDGEGIPVFNIPYDFPVGQLGRPKREAWIQVETLDWLVMNPGWGMQIVDIRKNVVVFELICRGYSPVGIPKKGVSSVVSFLDILPVAFEERTEVLPRVAGSGTTSNDIKVLSDDDVTWLFQYSEKANSLVIRVVDYEFG